MKSLKYIKSGLLVIICSIALTTSNVCMEEVTAQPAVVQQAKVVSTTSTGYEVEPLDVVKSPKAYLNMKITMNAKFDKFSTLGLDYKPAFKSSEEYISFLVKREDTIYDIPLSELKLFIKRSEAEKFIELKTDDEISITGTVFSDALGDAWVDVSSLTITKKAPNKDGVK